MIRKWLVALSLFTTPSAAIYEDIVRAARERQVVTQGFPESANFTLQIARLARREAKTERIDNQIVVTLDDRIEPLYVASYIHHEYAHACQMTMGGPSQSLFMDEASATLQEMLAFKDGGAWQSSVAVFQSQPQIPPLADLGGHSKFEYGGALFLFYLDQRFGSGDGRFVYRLWARAAYKLPHVDSAEWMTIVEAESGAEFTELVLAFAVFRMGYGGVRATSVSHVVQKLYTSEEDWPWPLGCLMLRVRTFEEAIRFAMRVEKERPFGVAFLKSDAEQGSIRAQQSMWDLEPRQSLMLAVCDLDKEAHLRRELKPTSLQVFFEFQKG